MTFMFLIYRMGTSVLEAPSWEVAEPRLGRNAWPFPLTQRSSAKGDFIPRGIGGNVWRRFLPDASFFP